MKDIMLKIIGKQFEQGAEEVSLEFITEGKLYSKGQSLYLVYEESEFFGTAGCKTRLKLSGSKVKMSRYGLDSEVDTEIEFEQGVRFTGYYATPYGAVEMEVLTNEVENTMTKEGTGFVNIDYHVALKGLSEGRNKINIQIM